MRIRIGARRSPLAVAQATWIADRLTSQGHECVLVGIESQGDTDGRQLTEIGGTGVFAAAVRDGLLAGTIDVAVHSLKDLPIAPAPGLVVAAIPEREDPRDVLIGAAPDQWREGTVIGTGSPRRALQVEELARLLGVTIEIVPIRGNVDTRIDLARSGQVDATILAAAGLKRLGRLDNDGAPTAAMTGVGVHALGLADFLPAAGQGALACECRDDATAELSAALADIDHAPSRVAVETERAFLFQLGAGCLAPLGVLVHGESTDLTLDAVAGRKCAGDASSILRRTIRGPLTSDNVRALADEFAAWIDREAG